MKKLLKKLFKVFVVFTMVISLSSCDLWLEKINEFLNEMEQEYKDDYQDPYDDDENQNLGDDESTEEDDNQNSWDEDENNSNENTDSDEILNPDDDDENNTNENTGNDENQNSGGNQNVVLNGAVNITSGRFPMAKDSHAEKRWNADEAEYVYAFDADGKCTLNGTRYYLKDVSYYEESKKELEGWKPIWSDDHASFIIDSGMHDYTTYDYAIKKIEERFLSYTIKDSSGTITVAAPTEEEKVQKMREVFGFTFDDLGSDYAGYEYTVTRLLKNILVSYKDNATVSDANALIAAAFELCKSIPESGKMYGIAGKYGEEITSAPETSSALISPEFSYYYNGNEIHVEAEIGNSGDFDNTLLLHVYVYN